MNNKNLKDKAQQRDVKTNVVTVDATTLMVAVVGLLLVPLLLSGFLFQ
ncbi:MAG: hypothetical protein AAGF66_07115 [Cyanobacteria bacterium P01_H01_bin.119]